MAVLDSMAKLISRMPYERLILILLRISIFVTFVASMVTNFVGCRPFEWYWQIYPDPGKWYGTCKYSLTIEANTLSVTGTIWLMTYEVGNIITDAVLMAVPFTLIISSMMPLFQYATPHLDILDTLANVFSDVFESSVFSASVSF